MKKNINSLILSTIIGLSSIGVASGYEYKNNEVALQRSVEPISVSQDPKNTKEECGTQIEGSDGKIDGVCAPAGGPIPLVSVATE